VVNLYLNQRRIGEVTVVDLKGRARIVGSTIALHRSVRCLVDEGKTQIVLDLQGVTDIDSGGLGELISSLRTVTNRGGTFKLVHLTEKLRELLSITKLLTVFDISENESEALKSFTGEGLKIVAA
jgi:anti-sigma B factor antagonist